ncbi:unnamed protein product [Eruca vesicaria subsp. sativa]|uniref:Uncharacterized protein n=1 Tax=Eruca vesicaria subsp. sativa TaxID=29727 RepID=A0ABC8L4M5_ERUVS|nr:unnamed protein product [Eruca vesicaria subsp. sativa]
MSSRMRSSKPPLPKSPIRLLSRQASSSTLQTPPPGLKNPGRRLSHGDKEPKLPIEYSSEFGEEEDDLRKRGEASNLEDLAADSAPPVFERGRLYEEYSARRNERLKRKNVGEESVVIKGTNYNLGVEPVTAKRRGTIKKKTETTAATKPPRYSLRSMTKENKKPPPPLPMNVSAVTSAKMKSVTTMRARRI